MLTRRDFIHAGCAAIATLVANPVEAWVHGNALSGANNNRVVINAITGFMNLAKGFNFNIDPSNQSANGYPVTIPASSATYGSNPSFPLNYYGQLVWKWTATGAMGWPGAPPIIVTTSTVNGVNSPVIFELPAGTGDIAPGNKTFISQALGGLNTPRVVFSCGWNIQSISNNGGVIRVNTKANYNVNGITSGEKVFIAGANSNTGANGEWTVSNPQASSFDLLGSTFTNAQAGAAGTAVYAPQNMNVGFYANGFGSISGMDDLVICKSTDEAAITSGLIVDPLLISTYQQLFGKPGGVGRSGDCWLRFMDLIGVQQSYEGNFAQRIPATYLCYTPVNFRPNFYIGAITNTADAYSCSDPSASVWSGSSYVDGATVQGSIAVTNSGGNPTLNVGGHGAKPIVGGDITPNYFAISAPAPSAGLSMVWTFTASWMAGLPGVVGTTYTFTYTTTATGPHGSDLASVPILNANLADALAADTTLIAAKITCGNGLHVVAIPRTAQAGRLTIAYTSGPAICTMITIDPGTIAVDKTTFVFNYLVDAWIYRQGGMVCSTPLEAIAEMCNRAGANCWFNWSITTGSWATSVTAFFRDNLSAGLKFGTEIGNELWNPSAAPAAQYGTLGYTLFPPNGGNTNAVVYSYAGLRAIQFAALATAAWTTTRPASDLYILQPSAVFDAIIGSNFDVYQLKGNLLDAAANTVYGTYGGLNGSGAVGSFNASPNRPVDITRAVGCAPYWGTHWWGSAAAPPQANPGINGTVGQNAPWLQASLDFTNGNTATAYASLVNQFNGTTVRSGGTIAGLDFVDYQSYFTAQEAMCAQYDAGRPALGLQPLAILNYEGAPQWAMGASATNGVNSVNSTDISALANQMFALGWNVSPYTVSGTNDVTEAATQVITMAQAWKFDDTYKNMIKTYNYQALVNTSGSHRETHPAQYGINASQWGLFPVSYQAGNRYKNFDAISEFNT